MLTWLPAIEQSLVFALMALGVYISFRVLNTADLTVDSSFPLGAAVSATMIVSGYSPWTAVLVAVVAGMLAGAITGILSTKLNITPLLSGILTMTGLYSVNLRIMDRPNVPLLGQPTLLRWVQDLGVARQYTGLIIFVVALVLVGVFLFYLLNTQFGIAMRATGNNSAMMNALGVNTDNMKIIGLALSNALIAFSGSLFGQYQGFADVNMGLGMVVQGLACVIIGQAILNGSVLKQVLGVVLGAFIYRSAIYFVLRMGVPATDLRLITAVLVVIALVLPQLKGKFAPAFLKERKFVNFFGKKAGDTEHA